MKYKNFKSFLEDKFWEYNPNVLDDDSPDKFNSWLEMDADNWIKLADNFADTIREEQKELQAMSEERLKTLNSFS